MASWIQEELSKVDFGDQRLNARLNIIADKFLEKPSLSICQGQGDWAAVKAAYRFFENNKVLPEIILQEHIKNTCDRVQKISDPVLAIQDTTSLNYSRFSTIEGLCETSRNSRKFKKGVQGFFVHTTLAVTHQGLPLGILNQKIFKHKKRRKKGNHKNICIEKKESYRWVESINQTAQLLPTRQHVTHVCDREGDIFEAFFAAQEQDVNFLIRAKENRIVGHRFHRSNNWKNTTLWKFMEIQPVQHSFTLEVPETSETKSRKVRCELKFTQTTYAPPQRSTKAKSLTLEPVTVYAIWLREINAPATVKEPLEWMLVTNIPTYTIHATLEKIQWYRIRWSIENFHKVLKSGCKVEDARLGDYSKLEKLVTLKSIIAYRIYWMTWINRVDPNLECTLALSDSEWKALYTFTNKTRDIPKNPPKITEALVWIARLGGFLARKNDGNPGTITIWRGWQRLREITQTWELFNLCTATYG